MKIFAVSAAMNTGSKYDFEKAFLVPASNAEDALAEIKARMDEGDVDYEVEEVDMERLKRGESILVYAKSYR